MVNFITASKYGKQFVKAIKSSEHTPVRKIAPEIVGQAADKFTPSVREEAVKEFAKKAGKGFKGKLKKWLEEFVENMKRMHGMS